VLHGRPASGRPELVFNYESKYTKVWNRPARFAPKYKYQPDYPAEPGLYSVEL